jgi:hypothetical protein
VARAGDISHEIAPAGAIEKRGKERELSAELWSERDSPRDGVALLLRSTFEFGAENGTPKALEIFDRKHVRHDDEAISIEPLAQFIGNQGRQPCSASCSERVRCAQAPNVQACPIKKGRTDQWIVREGLGAGEQGQEPEGRRPPAQMTPKRL